jgi:hypothetical protein
MHAAVEGCLIYNQVPIRQPYSCCCAPWCRALRPDRAGAGMRQSSSQAAGPPGEEGNNHKKREEGMEGNSSENLQQRITQGKRTQVGFRFRAARGLVSSLAFGQLAQFSSLERQPYEGNDLSMGVRPCAAIQGGR